MELLGFLPLLSHQNVQWSAVQIVIFSSAEHSQIEPLPLSSVTILIREFGDGTNDR